MTVWLQSRSEVLMVVTTGPGLFSQHLKDFWSSLAQWFEEVEN